MRELHSYEELLELTRHEPTALFYFSTPDCGVCKSLKPKVISLVEEHFPKMRSYYINTEAVPEARGQFSVYSVPVVLVFFGGREYIREARNFGIMELGAKIDRYYSMMFPDEDEDAGAVDEGAEPADEDAEPVDESAGEERDNAQGEFSDAR